MDDMIESSKRNIDFVEQLQNQIQICREALSDPTVPLTDRVETLEALLWAKIKDDKEYMQRAKELNEWCAEKTKDLKENSLKDSRMRVSYKRIRAREMFKAIMIFIDKKGLLPIGSERYG